MRRPRGVVSVPQYFYGFIYLILLAPICFFLTSYSGSLNCEMGIFKNSRVYVLATVAYTGSFLFGTTNLSSIGYQIQHANIFPEKDMIRV